MSLLVPLPNPGSTTALLFWLFARLHYIYTYFLDKNRYEITLESIFFIEKYAWPYNGHMILNQIFNGFNLYCWLLYLGDNMTCLKDIEEIVNHFG